MATLSYDEQSFMVGGRRIWLWGGTLHYARIPRERWADRIRAARDAGLNLITTDVLWSAHEPTPGRFHFSEEADLRAFLELIRAHRMYCLLRVGPFVGAEWDNGGLPAWLLREGGMRLREADPPFLEACSRFYGALLERIGDLQVTAPTAGGPGGREEGGGSGPIVMVQCEHQWLCHNPEQGEKYLRELTRYLRENGCTVPIGMCNNLWQRVEGTIDTWKTRNRLASDTRQLRVVQPHVPPMITDLPPGKLDLWGGGGAESLAPGDLFARLAEGLAAGAQLNILPFHGGTNFGFSAGRTLDARAGFVATSHDGDAPLGEAGERGQRFRLVKRIATFATQFGQLFAHLEPENANPAAVAPAKEDRPLSVIHQRGAQGEVVFLLRSPGDRTSRTTLLLPDGLELPVPMGRERAVWIVRGVNLAGAAELTYTNLAPWAFLGTRETGRLLVLFGPAGAEGYVCINGALLQTKVPEGKKPSVLAHEGISIAVLNTEQLDAAIIAPDGIAVGSSGLDESDQPRPLGGWARITHIGLDGAETARSNRSTKGDDEAPTLEAWRHAGCDPWLEGTAEGYQSLSGPTSLEDARAEGAYGWYQIQLKGGGNKAQQILATGCGDRLHVFRQGQREALIGEGPGAVDEPVEMTPSGRWVILAENLGRFDAGWRLGERKGLPDHLYAVKPMTLGDPTRDRERVPDPLEIRGFLEGVRRGMSALGDTFTWSVQHNAQKPIILRLRGYPARAEVRVNDVPVLLYDPLFSSGRAEAVLPMGGEALRRGKNRIRLALFQRQDEPPDPAGHLEVYQATRAVTEGASWAFAPWESPEDEELGAIPKSRPDAPCWYRAHFRTEKRRPLWFEPRGLTKGQLYLNGYNVGRYFHATAAGDHVGPQKRYLLPEAWLRTDEPNELRVFEEHGHSPTRSRLHTAAADSSG